MAYKWSWAFGPETALELNDLAQWQFGNTSPSLYSSSQDIIHTYTGDASDRWALQMDYAGASGVRTPFQVGGGKGWVSFYFYFNDPVNDFEANKFIIQIAGPLSADRFIGIQGAAGNSFTMIMDNNLVATSSVSLAKDTWHNVSVKYDMTMGTPSLGTWGAELFVNGISAASGSRTSANLNQETEIHAIFNGLEDAGKFTMLSDIIFYDSLSDPNPYGQFVTRTEVSLDVSDSGSWTPASNVGTNAQANSLSGSIATTPVVAEANPLTGENVIVSQTSIATQLGITPVSVYGVTGHLFASGSSATNLICAVAESASASTFTAGTAVVDGENMYAWATAPTPAPPLVAPWVGTDSIYLKAEVSGS